MSALPALLRAAWIACALAGAALAFAVVGGQLPAELAARSLPQASPATRGPAPSCGCAHDAHAHAPATPAAGPAATSRRFRVCAREEATATLAELRLHDDGPVLYAVGCGSRLHVLGFEPNGAAIEPRELLVLEVASAAPGEAPADLRALAADVDGDGLRDLVATVRLTDAAGAPSGGALYVLHQRAQGGFETPRRVLDVAAIDVAAGTLDEKPGADLAVVHAGDVRLGRPSALWLVSGGPAPLRVAQRPLAVGSRALALCDLDGDGVDDVITAGTEGLRLWPSSAAREEPLLHALTGVTELGCARLDAGPRAAALLAGEGARVLRLDDSVQPAVASLGDARPTRSVRVLRLDDGASSGVLTGYSHPELRVVPGGRAGAGTNARTLATIAGDAAVLDAQLAALGGGPAPDALVLSLSADESGLELGAVADVAEGARIELPQAAVELPAYPLRMRFALR